MNLRVLANTARYEARLSRLNENLKTMFDLQAINLKAIELPHYVASMSV